MPFKKGQIPWNKNIPMTQKTKKKLSKSLLISMNKPETKEKTSLKSKEFWQRTDYILKNSFPYEERICVCGCNNKFICKINKKQKFIHGHNAYLSKNKFKKRNPTWNTGLTKETDIRLFKSSVKSSESHKGKIPSNINDLIARNKNKKYTKERLSIMLIGKNWDKICLSKIKEGD